MIATRGLPEYEVLVDEAGFSTIALTLLRCVGALSLPNLNTRKGHAGPNYLTPGAQMQGRWNFQYSLIPHEGGWENGFQQAHNFARPMRAIRTSRGRGELAAEGSFLEVEPATVILSALKVAEDDGSTIVRVYNISNEPVEARVRLKAPCSSVGLADLNEENDERIEMEDGIVRLPLKANEIVTLKFYPPLRQFIKASGVGQTRRVPLNPDDGTGAGVPAKPGPPEGGAGAATSP
jgi:alpha-mannosidase